jgi:DNA-binding transcriptional ArsR family regulator
VGEGFILNFMVEDHLDSLFRALADPTRRAMLRALSAQPRTVGELASPYAISLAAASKHIQVLERAGLVAREIHGRVHTCRLDARPLHAGAEWLAHYERFWNQRLDALQAVLEAEDATNPTPAPGEAHEPRPE